MYRIGQSSDIHRLVKGRKLILGGVEIPYKKGLLGHSDADVLTHAIIEAIIGALGKGDIGKHFPDNDPKYRDISSLELLKSTTKMLKDSGYHLVNVDSLVLIQEPKLKDYIESMKTNIAKILEVDTTNINIKATTGEHLGFVGHKKGVVAQAVVLIEN